jgi:hypothetical protein
MVVQLLYNSFGTILCKIRGGVNDSVCAQL